MVADFYRGKRVLVTGGKGFIGSALCARLREAGAVVFPYDKRDRGADVTERGSVGAVVGGFRPSLVFHLAACTEVGRSHLDPWECYRTNFLGTLNVLESCRTGRVSVVVASSDKAYGEWPTHLLPYREDVNHQGLFKDPYSASKGHADLLSQEYARLYGLPVRVARPCNVYGPGQRNETTLVTRTALSLLRGGPATVHAGAGGNVREWLYVDDVVEAYLLLGRDVLTDSTAEVVYNVGSGQVESVAGIVYRVTQLVRPEASSEVRTLRSVPVFTTDGPAQTLYQCLDSSRFRSRFPMWWSPVPLDEGLRRTVEWYRKEYAR